MTFEQFAAPLIGLPVAHVWRGYGTAIFMEFGSLAPGRPRKDGSAGNPSGEFGLMIENDWRIERARSVLCGSSSKETSWAKALNKLIGAETLSVSHVGRLPEISVSLSNGLHVSSFMADGGQPSWALFDRRGEETTWITVRNGRVVLEREQVARLGAAEDPASPH